MYTLREEKQFEPNEYCSYQGYKVEEAHTSATCRFPKNGNNKLVTRIETKAWHTWNREWINDGPTNRGGAGLEKYKVNTNENYINYIQSNPKLVQTVDDLEVADKGTIGNYTTPDSPCDNKQQAVNPLPIKIPNGEIIMSIHTPLLSQQDLPIQARRAHLFPGLNKAFLSI